MSGYVIEFGIKSEFHKLKNFQLSKINHKANDIVQDLFKDYFSENDELPDWMIDFTFPSTLFDFLNFISNIAGLANKSNKKALKNYIKTQSKAFSVILSNRQLPSKDAGSTFHDISGFLSELNNWRERVDEPTFSIEDYEIEKLGWGINLRYAGSVNTMNDEDAKKALLMAIKFLKEILSLDISKYENKINPSNYQ